MIKIPIISRLNCIDYVSLGFAIGILIVEKIIRIGLFFFPYSLIDHIRYHLLGIFPRIFKGVDDEEIDDLKKPMVRSHNAKEIVENAPGCEEKYKLEEYAVFTPDGYILIIHRLKFNCTGNEFFAEEFGDGMFKSRMELDGSRPPVLLNHGAMMTSEAWLTAPSRTISDGNEGIVPNTLAHVLLHAGYDVWITNRRGNKYSCKHTHLSTHTIDFWSFSLDEPTCRDLPAVIEFLCEITGFGRVSLIGFSQGAAEILGALAMVRGLEKRVNLAILLAPTTKPRVRSFKASVIRTIVKMSPEVVFLFLGRKIMLSFVPFWQRILSPQMFVYFLDTSMKWMFGWTCENILYEDKIIYYQHLFSYTSVKQIVHWFQIMRARRFQMFDESPSMKVGTGHLPPAYPLKQIKTPLILFEGTADSLQDLSLTHLPALVKNYTIEGYEHLDFMWADSVGNKVWPQIVNLLNQLQSVNNSNENDFSKSKKNSNQKAPLSPPSDISKEDLLEAFKEFLEERTLNQDNNNINNNNIRSNIKKRNLEYEFFNSK